MSNLSHVFSITQKYATLGGIIQCKYCSLDGPFAVVTEAGVVVRWVVSAEMKKSQKPKYGSKPETTGSLVSWWHERAPLPSKIWIAVLMLAAVLRFVSLDQKPAHFDEGVNGLFLEKMKNSVVYNYDPTNYHGPLHFYLSFPFVATLGNNEVAIRLPAILFSMGTVSLLLGFSGTIGRLASLLSSVFFAVSPGSVFFSRYGIHEAELAFFVTLFSLSLLKLYKTGHTGWLAMLILSVSGGILTKETFFINMLTLPLAALSVLVLHAAAPWSRPRDADSPCAQEWSWLSLTALLVFAFVVIELFYSSWGTKTNLGWSDFIRSYTSWSDTGTKGAGHAKVAYDVFGGMFNYYWLALLARYEWPFLIAILAVLIYWKNGGFVGQVFALWSTGTIVAYSLIPYKTPWCVLSMLPSMSLTLGIFMSIPALNLRSVRNGIFASLLIAMSPLPYTLYLNLRAYDNRGEPYVYVQTSREAWRFISELNSAATHDPRFLDMAGLVALDSYYPLPWWLSGYSRVEYSGGNVGFISPEKYWAVISWRKLSEFLDKNSDRSWRYYRFKLRDAQEDVVALFDKKVFPEDSPPSFPPSLE